MTNKKSNRGRQTTTPQCQHCARNRTNPHLVPVVYSAVYRAGGVPPITTRLVSGVQVTGPMPITSLWCLECVYAHSFYAVDAQFEAVRVEIAAYPRLEDDCSCRHGEKGVCDVHQDFDNRVGTIPTAPEPSQGTRYTVTWDIPDVAHRVATADVVALALADATPYIASAEQNEFDGKIIVKFVADLPVGHLPHGLAHAACARTKGGAVVGSRPCQRPTVTRTPF